MIRKALYTQVITCYITLHYHLGFIYMMIRRYPDAIKALSNILIYLNRTKQYHNRSYQYEQQVKNFFKKNILIKLDC